MLKVALVGASGYSGLELIKILSRHPEAEIDCIYSTERVAGKKVHEIFPVLRNEIDKTFELTDITKIVNSGVDCVFLATPNDTSLELVPLIMSAGSMKVIDLSGSFRLRRTGLYLEYYGLEHEYQNLLDEAAYGLPELNRDAISKARLVANPGCYPTSVIIPVAPLLKAGMIDLSQRVIVDSKSGVSGAGRKPTDTTHFVETNESFKAYNVHKHRHEPEIIQELLKQSEVEFKLTFTPHLLPVNRGILSTIYLKLKDGISSEAVKSALIKAYYNDKFVRILPDGQLPEIKFVSGTPYCDIGFSIREDELIIVSAIDNLLKGASSQAVQNFNILFNFEETVGL